MGVKTNQNPNKHYFLKLQIKAEGHYPKRNSVPEQLNNED